MDDWADVMVSLILDAAIIVLLIITLVAGYRLHKRLRIFRADTEEFEPLIHALDNAAKRAETVLADLRQIAEDVGVKLTAEAGNTQRLLDELDFMTKRADQLADKLDNTISGTRHQETRQQSAAPVVTSNSPSEVLATAPPRSTSKSTGSGEKA